MADMGEQIGNPIFQESIKTVITGSDYPVEKIEDRNTDNYSPAINPGEIIMVVYDQQSIDMSLYAAAVLLASKGTTEKAAVEAYNGSKTSEEYIRETEYRLKCLGTYFLN